MADAMADKPICNESNHWKYILIKTKYITCVVLKYILYFAAYLLLKCSTLCKILSENLKTNDNMEYLPQHPVEKCLEKRCSLIHNNKSENLMEENKVIVNTVKDMLNKHSFDKNNKNELQSKINRTIAETVMETSNIKLDDSAFVLDDKNELQPKINTSNADTVDEISNMQPDVDSSLVQINHNELQPEVNIDNVGKTLNIQLDDTSFVFNDKNELQLEVNIINADTVNETLNTQLDDSAFVLDDKNESQPKVNTSNADTVNEISNTHRGDHFDFYCENDLQKNNEIIDTLKEPVYIQDKGYSSFSDNTPIKNELQPEVVFDSEIEMLNVQCNDKNSFYDLNSKNDILLQENRMIDNPTVDSSNNESDKNELQKEENNVTASSVIETSDSQCNDYNFFYQDDDNELQSKVNDILVNTGNNRSNKVSTVNSKLENKGRLWDKSINLIIKTIKQNDVKDEQSTTRTKINTNLKRLNFIEMNVDIFNLSPEYSLAHCCLIKDFSSPWMSSEFRVRFGDNIDVLLDQNLKAGDVCEFLHDNQYIFYLVGDKRESKYLSPSKNSLERALRNLLLKMKKLNLTKLAIPLFGLYIVPVPEAKEIISRVFSGSNIEVVICTGVSKLRKHLSNPPKINYETKPLWEIEPQTDIIMFVDMEQMYKNDWNDEVIENVNARYPFKEKLLKDIDIKPMAPGDMLSYTIGTEELFCIFTKPQDSSYFKCLKKAFTTMKSEMTGYRYLGIQQEPVNVSNESESFTERVLILLRTIFSFQKAEIWVCGHTDQHKAQQYQQYKKTVEASIEENKKGSVRIVKKSNHRNKNERKKCGTNNDRVCRSERNNHTNKPDDIPNVEQETKSMDNHVEKHWDE